MPQPMLDFIGVWLPLIFIPIGIVLFIWRKWTILGGWGLTFSRKSGSDALVGVVLGVVPIVLIFLVEWASGAIVIGPGRLNGITGFFIDVLPIMIFVALSEELEFRSFLAGGLDAALLKVTYGRWIIVAVTAVLFGAAHLGNNDATPISAIGNTIGGIIYTIAFLGTRSIVLPFFMHLTWNMTQGLLGIPISGHDTVPGFISTTHVAGLDWVSGGGFGLEAGVPGLIGQFLIVIPLVMYLQRRNPDGDLRTLRFGPDPIRRVKPAPSPAT